MKNSRTFGYRFTIRFLYAVISQLDWHQIDLVASPTDHPAPARQRGAGREENRRIYKLLGTTRGRCECPLGGAHRAPSTLVSGERLSTATVSRLCHGCITAVSRLCHGGGGGGPQSSSPTGGAGGPLPPSSPLVSLSQPSIISVAASVAANATRAGAATCGQPAATAPPSGQGPCQLTAAARTIHRDCSCRP